MAGGLVREGGGVILDDFAGWQLRRTAEWAHQRANWQPGTVRVACRDTTIFGAPKPADHTNCGGCGCDCHAPTDQERALWRQIADEIDAYLTPPEPELDDLFGGNA